MKKALPLLILSIIIGITAACSEDADCSMIARPMMQCNLYQEEAESGYVSADTLPMLTITALGTDSVIVNRQTEVKDLSLPLRYTADSTLLIFHYFDEEGTALPMEDTLTIRHSNTPYFVSMDCGYQMKQSILDISYTRHTLDSIHISNPEAGINGNENIKLFYR